MTNLARDQSSRVTPTIQRVKTSQPLRKRRESHHLSPSRNTPLLGIRKGGITTTEEAPTIILMEKKTKEGRCLSGKLLGMVALCWDGTQAKHPEVPFYEILHFQSLALQHCEYCKQRMSSKGNLLWGWPSQDGGPSPR